MAKTLSSLDFLWFVPSDGDNRYLNSPATERPPTPKYLREVAVG